MKSNILLLAVITIIPFRATHADPLDSKEEKSFKEGKPIIENNPAPKESGFYLSLFGGANVGQVAGSKDINVAGAKPIPAGTPAQITSYFLPGSNSSAPAAGVTRNQLIPNGTHLTSPTFSTHDDSNVGESGGLKFGYEFPTHSIFKPELELEAFYNGIDTQGTLTSKNSIAGLRTFDVDGDENLEPFLNPDATVPKTKAYVNFKDRSNSAVVMQNAIIKLDLGRFKPYVGAGLGLAYVSHNFTAQTAPGKPATPNAQVIQTSYGSVQRLAANKSTNAINNPPAGYFQFGSDSETTFAWQGLAGVEYAITPRTSVFTEYKALWFHDGPYYRNQLNNEVTVGVRFNF